MIKTIKKRWVGKGREPRKGKLHGNKRRVIIKYKENLQRYEAVNKQKSKNKEKNKANFLLW